MHAKEQLFRTLDDVNPDPRLAELEASIMGEVNKLGIGTMGFGGRTSLIGCKIGALNRLPASFFVSVAYDCWAFRRLGVVLDGRTGEIKQWLYRDPSTPVAAMADQAGFQRTGREVALRTPLTEEQVRASEGGRRRADLGPRQHRPRRRARAPDEARPADRSERAPCCTTAVRWWRRRATAGG